MARVIPNQNQRPWQLVARVFKAASSPWAGYANDADIGVLMTMLYALNFAPGVNKLSLFNPWTVDSWPEGFTLAIPEPGSRVGFPKGVTPAEFRAKMGLDPDSPNGLVGGQNSPSYAFDRTIPNWVEERIKTLKTKKDLYNEKIALGYGDDR